MVDKAEGQTIAQRSAEVWVESGAPTFEDPRAKCGRDNFRDFDNDDPASKQKFVETPHAQCPSPCNVARTGYRCVARSEAVLRIGQDWKTFSNARRYQLTCSARVTHRIRSPRQYSINWTEANIVNTPVKINGFQMHKRKRPSALPINATNVRFKLSPSNKAFE